jgi:cardiolipin synthase
METKLAQKVYSETIFTDGVNYFNSLIQEINEAQRFIELETYIFQNDILGQQIIQALIEAAKRGVKIRILVDGAGSSNWGGTTAKLLEDAHIETRIFHPLPWRLSQWGRTSIRSPFFLKVMYFFSKINKRNHRKVCIIDRKTAYIGSFNISKCHLTKEQGGDGWRDTAVRLKDIDSNYLLDAFDAAWDSHNLQERFHNIFQHVNINSPIRLNYTRHHRRLLYKNLLRRIARCKHRIWITNAYFVPDNFLLKKLIDRADAGVDVRILLPQKSDVFIMPWASATFYECLLKSGVRIFEYIPSMLHAKTFILDDWVMLGSSNLNYRSLLHDLEIDVVLSSVEAKKTIEQQFLQDLTQSREIHWIEWNKRSSWRKIIGRLILYIKFWI